MVTTSFSKTILFTKIMFSCRLIKAFISRLTTTSTHPSSRLPYALYSHTTSHTTCLDHSLLHTQILKIREGRSPNGHQWIS